MATAITQSDAGAESSYNCPRMHTTRDDTRFMYSPIEAALKVLNDIYSRKKLIGEAALAQSHGGSARGSGPTE
jgi:hypothetical protein